MHDELLQEVHDDYVDMVDRVMSYYTRYVDSMWSVVVLHTRHVLGDQPWREHITPYEERYVLQAELELELYTPVSMHEYAPGEEALADLRSEGLDVMSGLDEMHEELEHDMLMDLLAQRTMTVANARQLGSLSRYRLERHAALRRQVRLELDTAWFYMCDVVARCKGPLSKADVAADATKSVVASIRPLVVPL